MNQIRISPLGEKEFGAVVVGVDIPKIGDDEIARVKKAFLTFGFLVFPDQHLTLDENIQFGRLFGDLEFGGIPMANQERLKDGSYGKIYGLKTQRMRTNVGNETWHTDSTYMPISSKCAMLSAVVVPAEGGETELADMRAGYLALDAKIRGRIDGLSAYHSAQYSQANDLGDFPEQSGEGIYHGEAYLRPIVKIHPETGKKNLFIGRHAFGIPGLSRKESRTLLGDLLELVVSDESRVYRHSWTSGDTLIWDNRALLHRAKPYDYSQARVLTATRIAGDPETELSFYPTDPAAQAGRQALAMELQILREEARDRLYGASTASAQD